MNSFETLDQTELAQVEGGALMTAVFTGLVLGTLIVGGACLYLSTK